MKAPLRSHIDGPTVRMKRIALSTLSLLLFAWGWELSAPHMNGLLFPTFTQTVAALVELLRSSAFWRAMWLSNQALLVGFTLAAAMGISLGLWMGRSRTVERLASPYLSVFLVTPVSALIPIFIIATGLGIVTRVLIVFTFAFVIIVVTVRAGIRALDPSWVEMATSYGASERQIWWSVLLPGILPALMSALRLGLGRALSGMVAAELLVVAVGLGGMILEFQGNFDSAYVFAAILCIVIEAVALTEGAKYLEKRLCSWRTAMEDR